MSSIMSHYILYIRNGEEKLRFSQIFVNINLFASFLKLLRLNVEHISNVAGNNITRYATLF